jgi:uncharacterized protein YjbI with pentapeptide repeats
MIGADLKFSKFLCLFPNKPEGEERQYSDLKGANLTEAMLLLADFSGAELERVNFTNIKTMIANFTDAELDAANFAGASLDHAVLQKAILFGADLSRSRYLIQEQLTRPNPPFLCENKLPSDLASLYNRDCDRLPAELVKRSSQFCALDTAKQYVEDLRQNYSN